MNSYKSLLFHGGDTGSIPVRDANTVNHLQESRFTARLISGPLTPCLFANARLKGHTLLAQEVKGVNFKGGLQEEESVFIYYQVVIGNSVSAKQEHVIGPAAKVGMIGPVNFRAIFENVSVAVAPTRFAEIQRDRFDA